MREFLSRHRHLIAYLLLTVAVAYSVAMVRTEAAERRAAVVESAQMVAMDSCERDNETRRALVLILRTASKSEEGTPRSDEFYASAYKRLRPADCAQVAGSITDKP